MYKASEANKLSTQNNKELHKSAINELMEIVDEQINEVVKEGGFEAVMGFGAHCRRFRIDDVHGMYNVIARILGEYGYDCSLSYCNGCIESSILHVKWYNA